MFVAAQSGYEIPQENIEHAAKYWLNGELGGGGWGYVHRSQRTVTMTLSGIACLSWLRTMLDPANEMQDSMAAAIVKAWSIEDLGEDIENATNWPYYGLHTYLLAAQATDMELEDLDKDVIPTQEHLEELLAERQNEDGSFGDRSGNFKTICTSLAILTFQKP